MPTHYRIAVVAACPFPYPRGTPIRIFRMAEALAAHGHDVHVAAYHLGHRMQDLPFALHRIPNIPTYRKTSPGPSYQKILIVDPLLALKLYQVVVQHDIQVIHAHHYEGLLAGWLVARLTGVPLVFDVHTLLESELPQYALGLPAALVRSIASTLDHALPPCADHIVTVTNLIRDKLIREIGIPPERITTVYGAAEEELTKPLPGEPASAVHTLIYAGNLAAYQGIELMLQAFALVLAQKPGTLLKIVTNSPLGQYRSLIEDLGIQENVAVEAADYFRLPQALHSARIALNPRQHADGLPMKLLNYMATGRAIVSFEGSAEILRDGETALIVRDGRVESFAEAILRLLQDEALAQRLAQAARATVQEFFVWESMVQKIEEAYARILKGRHK